MQGVDEEHDDHLEDDRRSESAESQHSTENLLQRILAEPGAMQAISKALSPVLNRSLECNDQEDQQTNQVGSCRPPVSHTCGEFRDACASCNSHASHVSVAVSPNNMMFGHAHAAPFPPNAGLSNMPIAGPKQFSQ